MEKAVQLKSEVLIKSREIVCQTYEKLYELEPNQVIDLVCSYDRTWHKRGHTSLYGIGCVIEIRTGLVIDYEILSKYCHMCVKRTKSNSAQEKSEGVIFAKGKFYDMEDASQKMIINDKWVIRDNYICDYK